MRKTYSKFTIVSVYIITALLAADLYFGLLPNKQIVIISYVIFAIALTLFLIVSSIYFKVTRQHHELESLEKIMQSINAMVILWDADLKYISVNVELTKTLGYTSEDLKDEVLLRRVLPPDAFSENLQAIINSKDEEFTAVSKSGVSVSTVWNTSMMSCYTYKNQKRYLMMSIGLDITETVRMKEELIKYSKELAETENRYSLSMELSEIGLMLRETDSEMYYLSEQLQHMLGINKQYIKPDELRNLFHPADMVVFDAIASVESTHSGDDDKIHSVDFRAMAFDKTYHWFQFRYKITTNENRHGIGGSIIDITKDKEKDHLIETMAYIDEVTQIYNRNKFMQIGQETFECADGKCFDYWVIVFDIDNFHIINDTCGYLNGNKLLYEFAGVLTKSLSSGGFVARIGGDNFAALVKYTLKEDLPVDIIKKVQQGLAELSSKSFSTQTLTCSAGYCRMSDGGTDFAQVLDHAEFSLSLSDGSRNSIIRYDNNVHDKIIAGTAIEKELALAIDNHEFVLYYQPKINLSDGEIVGMEALIRWIKPDGTIIPPNQFIPVAERSMLITRISDFVLYEACRQNKEWQQKGYKPITVSINLTAVDFYQTDVKDSILKTLEKTGLEAKWLDVELTESLALKDIDHAIQQMKEIKELGVKLSMDDFGTGYSSLSYIQVLPITLLKLDRSFIMYLEDDEISREIVSAVIRIAKSKRIETIAEGIETIGQAQILKQSGCDLAQGYFFGRPMSADKFEEFMIQHQRIIV